MNIFSQFEDRIKNLVQTLDLKNISELDVSKITVEPPRDPSHGDLATNAAMVLSKQVGMNPRELATRIADALSSDADVTEALVAGPGFINLRLAHSFWLRHLHLILSQGSDYGRGLVGNGMKVNVEYVSANPTGPMHVGHCRGAVVGDSLANLLAFAGYDVTREYVINDAGSQIDVLANSVWLRYREALGEAIGEIPAGLYPGDYLVPVGQALAAKYGETLNQMGEEERLETLRVAAVDAMMELIKQDLAALNVCHDVFFSEKTLHIKHNGVSEIDRMLEEMRKRGFVYDGRLPPPKGELPEDWEDREQTLFRSTEVGDDMDRPLVKSDGAYTYFAADVAYFRNKWDRGFKRLVYVLGADHGGYVKRLRAVARAIAGDETVLDVLLCQLVKLYRNGEPVRMSKRSGDFVTLRDVVDEVGTDAVRFMMLYRKAEAPLDFDFAKVTEQSRDNPVFYVQYAHSRCRSVLRQAREDLPGLDTSDAALLGADLGLLEDQGELALVRKMAEFPRIVEQAARSDEPHRMAFYLYDLASELHKHWSRGKENPALRFVNQEKANLTLARLALLRAVSGIIACGLAIVGAAAPEEMR
ncbi:MAG: arginine--tRNA ligase [Rhizobiaceae bacterium]